LGKKKVSEESQLDPWTLFLNAMRAPMTRDRYKTRVAKFFNFVGIRGKTLEESQLPFKPYQHFTKNEIEERLMLYQKICERIWSTEGFDRIFESSQ